MKKSALATKLNAELTNAYTLVDETLLDRRKLTSRHLLWYADNCEKLADYMEALPKSLHDQGDYAHDAGNKCGTPACALGHAAYSNEFDGLQFGVKYYSARLADVRPVINGGTTDWDEAGVYFFGDTASERVFASGSLKKDEVVRRLRDIAVAYREEVADARVSDSVDSRLDF